MILAMVFFWFPLVLRGEVHFANGMATHAAVDQNQWYNFGVGAPPILGPILVGIAMCTGGTIWILTHGHVSSCRAMRAGRAWASSVHHTGAALGEIMVPRVLLGSVGQVQGMPWKVVWLRRAVQLGKD